MASIRERLPRLPTRFPGVPMKLVTIIVVLIITVVIATNSVAIIPTGHRGVLISWGGKVEERILQEGLNFKTPFAQSVVKMTVQIQKVESSESTASKDLQEITTTVAVNYRLDPNLVNTIYKDMAKDYERRVIKPNIEESLKATTAQYTAEELITKRASVKATFDDILEERLRPFGIQVVAVSLVDFQFSEAFSQAIDAKVTAEQDALRAKNELERIKYEAQQQIIQAEAERNATIARAYGVAQARLIEANATSEAIRLITEQISPEYALYQWITQWDGKLPVFLGGEGSSVIIDISQLLNSTITP